MERCSCGRVYQPMQNGAVDSKFLLILDEPSDEDIQAGVLLGKTKHNNTFRDVLEEEFGRAGLILHEFRVVSFYLHQNGKKQCFDASMSNLAAEISPRSYILILGGTWLKPTSEYFNLLLLPGYFLGRKAIIVPNTPYTGLGEFRLGLERFKQWISEV